MNQQSIWPEEWVRKSAYHDRWYKKLWRRINTRRYRMVLGVDPANGIDFGTTTIAFKDKKNNKIIIESVGVVSSDTKEEAENG